MAFGNLGKWLAGRPKKLRKWFRETRFAKWLEENRQRKLKPYVETRDTWKGYEKKARGLLQSQEKLAFEAKQRLWESHGISEKQVGDMLRSLSREKTIPRGGKTEVKRGPETTQLASLVDELPGEPRLFPKKTSGENPEIALAKSFRQRYLIPRKTADDNLERIMLELRALEKHAKEIEKLSKQVSYGRGKIIRAFNELQARRGGKQIPTKYSAEFLGE